MAMEEVRKRLTIETQSSGLDGTAASINKVADAEARLAVTSTSAERAQISLDTAFGKLERRYVDGVRQQQELAKIQQTVNAAVAQNPALQERANAVMQGAAMRLNQVHAANENVAKSTGLARHELINLSRQAQDVGVSLASGQSPLLVLAQQGSQIADVFASSTGSVRGFFTQAIGFAGRFVASTAGVVTSIGAIAGGALYMAGAWQESQREIERALIGIGRRSGVTANDINQIARTSATATGLSVDQARDAALEFVKTGAIYKENIKAATDVTHNFSIVTGKDAKDAAQLLGAALADPIVGADSLNKSLGFLDGRTRELIITLTNQNRIQEAQRLIINGVATSTAKATDTLGPFEKAWAAVANAASRAKNAVGAALTPATIEQRRDALVDLVNQRSAPALEGTPVDNRSLDKTKINAAKQEIEALNESLRETARAKALAFDDPVARKVSIEADDAVKSLLPFIGQLQQVEKLQSDIRRAQSDPNVGGKQGLAGFDDQAMRASEVLKLNIKNTADETDRANQAALQLTNAYGTASVEVAKVLDNLAQQAIVAGSVTGAERLANQERARAVQLLNEGKSASDAMAVAAAERKVSEAQINAQVEEQIHSLEQATELIKARQNGTEATVKAEQAYENAIRAGADAGTAAALQAATLSNERARANEQAAVAAEREQAAIDAIIAANREWARTHAFTPSFIPDSQLQTRPDGTKTQFNPQGYTSKMATPAAMFANNVYGAGGFSVDENLSTLAAGQSRVALGGRILPNAQGLEKVVDNVLKYAQGSISDAMDSLLQPNFGLGDRNTGVVQASAQTLSRLTELLPDDASKMQAIWKQIQVLSDAPQQGLVQRELIASLTEQMKQLTDASKENTAALNAQLDPLMLGGHDALNAARLGYFHAAGGLDVMARGPTSGDQIPFHAMVNGGERITITRPDQMPRAANSNSTVSNDNKKIVHQTNNITINGADTPQSRLRASQIAQGFVDRASRSASAA